MVYMPNPFISEHIGVNVNITSIEFIVLLILITILWIVGFFKVLQWLNNKKEDPFYGVVGYSIGTILVLTLGFIALR